jgi:hypothetical protein
MLSVIILCWATIVFPLNNGDSTIILYICPPINYLYILHELPPMVVSVTDKYDGLSASLIFFANFAYFYRLTVAIVYPKLYRFLFLLFKVKVDFKSFAIIYFVIYIKVNKYKSLNLNQIIIKITRVIIDFYIFKQF